MLPAGDAVKPADAEMKIAVVGRPNTGKSTLINTLARAERMIVSERPGTTRDSVDVHFELDGVPFLAIDTAGIKRSSKIRDNLDFYSVHRAQRSIRRADVVLLFLDPTQGITRLDKQLADYIAQEHKPCIFTINKWDLMLSDPGRPVAGEHGPVRQPGPACVPLDELHADGVHHGQDRQERQGAHQPLAVAVQAVAKAREHRHAQPDRPRGRRGPSARRRARTARRASTTPPRSASPRPRSSCSSTAPGCSTRPTSATCSTSSARNCRSATSRSSSTCVPASRPSPASRSSSDDHESDDDARRESGGSRADRPDQAAQREHLDFATRFLNREVNELLSELDG